MKIATRIKTRRLSQNLTQTGLTLCINISILSLKRFEKTGKISFELLLNTALVLNCLNKCKNLFIQKSKPNNLFIDESKTLNKIESIL